MSEPARDSWARGPDAPRKTAAGAGPPDGGEDAARGRAFWSRQVLAILRLELKRSFFGKRTIPVYFLALLPVLVLGGRALILALRGVPPESEGHAAMLFAVIYQTFVLRFVVFFGCAGIFTNLFRGEILDRSLHYYFLCPVRRDVLVAGKFLSGLVTAVVVFCGSTAAALALLHAPLGPSAAAQRLLSGTGLSQLLAYLAIAALGCLGYGAVFLATGLLFRNPMIPAAAILGWESLNFLLPPLLKKVSVIYYLVSLCPVPISQGPIALIADPAPAWIAVFGLLALAAAGVALAGWRVRLAEIDYGGD